jgi:hypothetical protein
MTKRKVNPKPIGRPTKKLPELVQLLCKALEDCMPLDRACDLIGIGRRTVYEWIQTDPVFRAQVAMARAKAIKGLVKGVSKDDPGGKWKILRSIDHKNFGDNLTVREVDEERDDEMEAMTDEQIRKGSRK